MSLFTINDALAKLYFALSTVIVYGIIKPFKFPVENKGVFQNMRSKRF